MALLAATCFAPGCSSEAVRVGTANDAEGPSPACPALDAAPRAVSRMQTFADNGVWAGGESLFFFRGPLTLNPLAEPAKIVRLPWPDGVETVLGTVPRPAAVAAGGHAVYWVDGPSVLWYADLTNGQTRIVDRRGGLQDTRLAVTSHGALAFVRQYQAGGRIVSALWRGLPGTEPEPLALIEGAVTGLFVSADATLLVGAAPTPASDVRLFAFGALETLDAKPEVERFSGARAAPLPATAPAAAAFDGTNVYYVVAAPGDGEGRFQVGALSLATGERTVLAWSQAKQPDSKARIPSSLILRGNELVWVESDEGDRDCTVCEPSSDPYWWVSHQSIRSVSTSGGDVRVHWSADTRVDKGSGVGSVLPIGCELAIFDRSPKLTMVLP